MGGACWPTGTAGPRGRPAPGQERLGGIGIDLLDDFVEAGSASTGGTLKEARALWARLRKTELLEQAIEKARKSQAGFEVGLRQEFRIIARGIIDKNKKYRGSTPDEVKAINAVVEGEAISNNLRRLGALAGGQDTGRATLNAIAGSGLGYGVGTYIAGPLIGGPIGAGLTYGVGNLAAKKAMDMTERRANLARAIAARGEALPRKPGRSQTLAELMIEGRR